MSDARINNEKGKSRYQYQHTLILAAAAAAALICGCVYPQYDGDEFALEEQQSVWQYLKVYSIYQDRLGAAPGSMTPYDMFAAINDSLGGGRYTEYLDDRPGGGVFFPPDTEFDDPWPLTDSTVYFYLPEFSDTALWVFQRSLREMSRYPNIIIDVRYNGGGLLSVSSAILGELLPHDTPYIRNRYRRYNSGRRAGETAEDVSRTASPRPALSGKRIAVLMNGYSASASEILAAGLKDAAGAYLVGGRSYGKGIGQVIITRGDDRKRLSITFLEISGLTERTGQYHKVGLAPDAVPDSVAATPDETIKAAFAKWWGVPNADIQDMRLTKEHRELYYAFKMLEPEFTADAGGDVVDNDAGDADGLAKQRAAADKLRGITVKMQNAKANWRPMGAVIIDEKDLPKIQLLDD